MINRVVKAYLKRKADIAKERYVPEHPLGLQPAPIEISPPLPKGWEIRMHPRTGRYIPYFKNEPVREEGQETGMITMFENLSDVVYYIWAQSPESPPVGLDLKNPNLPDNIEDMSDEELEHWFNSKYGNIRKRSMPFKRDMKKKGEI